MLLSFLSRLPLSMLYVLCGAAAGLLRVVRWRRRFVDDGLALCLPDRGVGERDRVARDFYAWVGRLIAETLREPRLSTGELERRLAVEREFARRQGELLAELLYTPRLSADDVRERVVLTNPGLIAGAAPGQAVMLITGHQNNFEWALQRVALDFGARMVGLYKPIRNARLDAWFRGMRQRFGSRLIPAKTVLRELARDRDYAAIGIVADQAPTTSPQKHWTTFLGQETAFYMGPELLTRPLRAQAFYGRVRRRSRGRYEVSFEPLHERGEALPKGTITERYAQVLEAEVRADPAGWWWSHRRWKLKRERIADGG